MAVKNQSAIVVRGALQNVSQAYKNEEYVADKLFPILDGNTSKTKVAKYVKGPWFRDAAEPRGPGAAAVVGEFSLATHNLDPINYAHAAKVTKEEREDAAEAGSLPTAPDSDALELNAEKLDLSKEVRTANVLHTTVWSGVAAGGEDVGGLWGTATAANDTFLADMRKARDKIRIETGKIANTLFLDYKAWSALQVAPALIALLYPQSVTVGSPILDTSAIAKLAQVKEVIIGWAIKTSVEETVGDADSAFVGEDVWGVPTGNGEGVGFLYYKPARPGKMVASPGYQYRLTRGGNNFRQSETWYDAATKSTYYDTEESVDISPVGLDLGYLFKNTSKAHA